MMTILKHVFQKIVRPWVNASWTAMMIPSVKLLVFQLSKLNIRNALAK